jgi:hypothetical protein
LAGFFTSLLNYAAHDVRVKDKPVFMLLLSGNHLLFTQYDLANYPEKLPPQSKS